MKNLEKIIYPKDPTASVQRIEDYHVIYEFKHNICKAKNPKIIAEIGIRTGYSAWAFLQACPEATYFGFDANNGTHGGAGGEDKSFWNWAKKILRPYRVNLVELDTQGTDDLGLSNVDFFHVDGDHTSKGVMHDLDLAIKAINRNGWILVDDLLYLNDVATGVKQWLADHKNEVNFQFVFTLRGDMIIWRKDYENSVQHGCVWIG